MINLESWHRRLVLKGPSSALEQVLLSLLCPLGWLYGLIAALRVACYRRGLFRRYRAAVPVVSVGNIAVGGTGKTPVVDLLVKYFQQQGLHPAVVSRGYGGKNRAAVGIVCRGAGPLLKAIDCGDEPFLLARRNPEALILVARKRSLGVQLAVEELGADIVILDDGFQHLAVVRDLDLVLLDSRAPFGNGRPLPAGLLREFPSGLKRADHFVLTRCGQHAEIPVSVSPLWRCRHRLASHGLTLGNERISLDSLKGQRLAAFAGIADPESFFNDLEAAGLTLSVTLALSDHVEYDAALLARLQHLADGVDFLLTTEKDGVKLATESFPTICLQVPVAVDFEDEVGFQRTLQAFLKGVK